LAGLRRLVLRVASMRRSLGELRGDCFTQWLGIVPTFPWPAAAGWC